MAHNTYKAPQMDDDSSEGLELPLRDPERDYVGGGGHNTFSSDSDDSNGPDERIQTLGTLVIDIAASVGFWYVLIFVYAPDNVVYACLGVLLLAMILWRFVRARLSADDCSADIPYTCGYVSVSGKELFLVATLHISPRAPRDVKAVIDGVFPDIAMIELDDERLDRMRGIDVEQPQEPKKEDLQPIRLSGSGIEPVTILAQRALWNAERTGEQVSGTVVFDEDNAFGIKKWDDDVEDKVLLVRRGSPDNEFAPFALKAHRAAQAGAQAILVISQDSKLPLNRIGGGTIRDDFRVAWSTCSCGFPPIPVLLMEQADGERIREACQGKRAGVAQADFQILEDSYPRRTLRRRLCQTCALMFSGIGILYGIIECFSVEVGAEFLAAEIAANAKNIPCVCIDVNLNSFWSSLGAALLPTPCNVAQSLLAWLAFPRVFFRVLFPARGSVDVMGSMVLHVASFPLRTWVAFILAGFCASFVTTHILEFFGTAAEQGAETTGVVSKDNREAVQSYIMLGIEMYMLPQVYGAVAAARDESMYRSIVKKNRERNSRRMVVVVGAGHANGILHRTRTYGL